MNDDANGAPELELTAQQDVPAEVSWEFECGCGERVGGFASRDAAFEGHADHRYDRRADRNEAHALLEVEGVI